MMARGRTQNQSKPAQCASTMHFAQADFDMPRTNRSQSRPTYPDAPVENLTRTTPVTPARRILFA